MSRALLLKTFDYLGRRIQSAHLNESAADGTQALQKEIAEYLDAPQSTPARSQAQERGELREAWQKLELVAANCQPLMQAYHKIKKEWNAVDNAVRALASTPATDAGGEQQDTEIIVRNLSAACDNADRLAKLPLNHLFHEVLSSDAGDMQVVVELLNRLWPKWVNEPDDVFTPTAPPQARPSGEPGDTQWKAGYLARLSEETAERPEPKHPTLWRYLDNAHKKQIARHIMVANRQPDGGYHFYIHPEGVSGDTQDYLLWPDPFTWEDMLVNRLDSPPPDAEGFKRALSLALSAQPAKSAGGADAEGGAR